MGRYAQRGRVARGIKDRGLVAPGQGRSPRFLTYLILLCIVLLCTLGFEFISEA